MFYYKGYNVKGRWSGGSLSVSYSKDKNEYSNGIRLEIRPCVGDKKFDKEKRMIAVLSFVEIAEILRNMEARKSEEMSFNHKNSPTPKMIYVKLSSKGTMWTMAEQGNKKRALAVGLSVNETRIVQAIIVRALYNAGVVYTNAG